jgi:hypothetical protein
MEGGESKVSSRYLMHLFSYVYVSPASRLDTCSIPSWQTPLPDNISTRNKKIRDKFEAQNELAVVPFGLGSFQPL